MSNYVTWDRARGRQITANFHLREFECKCGICKFQIMSLPLITLLQSIREEIGIPITVTSAFRCARHQQKLREGGAETASGKSSHEEGIALDLACEDLPKLVAACKDRFDNYGIARTFIHVDTRLKKADGTKRTWTYK